jgi:hypothetical protein
MKKNLIIVLLLALISNKMYSQKGMKDYDANCYCDNSGTHPFLIINKGNNWDILVALKDGKTLEELKKTGIKFTQKQIEVLQAMNLIDKKDEKYKTLVTILNAEETNKIRLTTKEIAKKIIPIIQNDFTIFSKFLKEQGFENNLYTVFFSYIMDNIVWNKFESKNIISNQELTVEKPIWDGTIWFIYPKRKFECGTNSHSFENLTAATNWTDSLTLSKTNIVNYEALLKDFKKNSRITDTTIKDKLIQYDICDASGKLKVPFIKNDTTNNFNICCNHIANKIVNYLVENIDFSTIETKYNIQSKGDAIIILYHDIMWDILDILEENGQLIKPIAFSHPEKSVPSGLKDLFFIYEE